MQQSWTIAAAVGPNNLGHTHTHTGAGLTRAPQDAAARAERDLVPHPPSNKTAISWRSDTKDFPVRGCQPDQERVSHPLRSAPPPPGSSRRPSTTCRSWSCSRSTPTSNSRHCRRLVLPLPLPSVSTCLHGWDKHLCPVCCSALRCLRFSKMPRVLSQARNAPLVCTAFAVCSASV